MGESGSGGTSVGEGPPWLWISGGAAVALVLYIVLGGKGEAETSDGAEPPSESESFSGDEATPTSVPPAGAPSPNAAPAATAVADPALTAVTAEEPDVDALLATLAGSDALESRRAGIQLEQLGMQARATEVLWRMMRTGDAATLRRAKEMLEAFQVPMTLDRKLAYEPSRPKGNAEWLEASLEVVDDQVVVSLSTWYGSELFGGEAQPYLELTLRGAAGNTGPAKKITPQSGSNQVREVLLSGATAGTYECSVFMWGQNQVTNTQHNVSGPSLRVTKP
jgi:hypothetical protein